MIKKVCILASLSQKSDIEEAVAYYKSQGYIVDYPTEQRDKTLFEIDYDYICRIAKAGMVVAIPKYEEDLVNRLHTSWLLQNTWAYQGRNTIRLKENEFGGEIHERCC